MRLKAIYDPDELAAFNAAKERGESNPKTPRTTHVEVRHTGVSAEQNFADTRVDEGLAEGWIAIDGAVLSVKTDGEPLRYAINLRPGYFCKSTGEAIPMSASAWGRFRFGGDSSLSQAAARSWLAANGKQANDYDITTAYHCVLDAQQHARHRAVIDPVSGEVVGAHMLQEA